MRYKLLLFLVAALSAAAGPISVSGSIGGQFHDPDPATGIFFEGLYLGYPVTAYDWGSPGTPATRSQLNLTLNDFTSPVNQEFVATTLYYLNVVNDAPPLIRVSLDVTLNFTDPSGWMEGYVFPFKIENVPEEVHIWPPSLKLTPDTVRLGDGTALFAPETFQVGDWTYTLTVLGWRNHFGSDPAFIDHLTVGEYGVGAADLIARVDVHAPEAGTVSFILIGLALMATRRFVRR